jgi:hypothetical protein
MSWDGKTYEGGINMAGHDKTYEVRINMAGHDKTYKGGINMLNREAANTKLIVFALIRLGFTIATTCQASMLTITPPIQSPRLEHQYGWA